MRRNELNAGTAHVLVEVSKAPENISAKQLDAYCNLQGKKMRRELQWQGKHVIRTYKLLDNLDVKVLCDWVVLGNKDSPRSLRNSKKNTVARMQLELEWIQKGTEKYGDRGAPSAL